MKAVLYDRFGPPEVLRMGDVAAPRARSGQVGVKVRATSVNAMDVVFRSGALRGRVFSGLLGPKLSVLGSDFAGDVVEVGGNVRDLSVGERVVGVSGFRGGAYAEYVAVEASEVAVLPPSIDYPDAAAFASAGVASLVFLQALEALEAGRRVMIVGASGGLGTFAVQLAHHRGADVTGVCSTHNVELVRSLGAKEVIDYTQRDPTAEYDAYDVIFDTVAAASYGDYRRALAPGGVYSTTVVTLPVLTAMALNPLRRSGRRAHTMIARADTRRGLETLCELAAEGSLASVIELRLPLEDVVEAHRHYETGRTRGKIVLTV